MESQDMHDIHDFVFEAKKICLPARILVKFSMAQIFEAFQCECLSVHRITHKK